MRYLSIKTIAPLIFTLAIIFLPLITIAEGTIYTSPGGSTYTSPGGSTYTSPAPTLCNGIACSVENPLKVTNFCDLLKIILQAILIIGLPVAVVFLLIVGFKFILAQGNPEAIGVAQKNFLNTVIGIAIFIGAWTIAQVIAATMAALGVPGLGSCGQ